MWVDENAGADATGGTTGADDMAVTVAGQQYSADINMDIDSDGVEDTAVIERPDGSAQTFVDLDGDGDADSYLKLDEHGDVVARAAYDQASGDWVATEPGGGAANGDRADIDDPGTTSGMTADMPAGDMPLGPPTVDTNDDGVADTAVAQDDAGNTLMFTDVTGDGAADIVVVVTPGGESTTYEHTGDGEWTPVGGQGAARTSLLGASVDDDTSTVGAKGWGGADSTNVFGVAHINPATGQWISPN